MKYPCKIKLAPTENDKIKKRHTNKEMHGYSRPACVSVVGGSNKKRQQLPGTYKQQ